MKYLDKIKRGGQIGIKYNGTVQNGLAHGKGIMIFNGSREFEGFFNNGKCIGHIFSVPLYNNGTLIEGHPLNSYYGYVNNEGLPDGLGHLYSPLLKIEYYGEFKDGKYHGYGKLSVNGTERISKFENGKAVKSFYSVNVEKKVRDIVLKFFEEKDKLQKTVCDSCDTYIGEYPTGKGTMKFKNGDVYEGEYPTGKGTMTFENGDKRTVNLQNGKQTMSFLKKKVNSEQVDEIEKNVKQIKEKLKKIQIDQLNDDLQSKFKKLKSLLEHDNLTNEQLNEAEELLKKIQAPIQPSHSLGIKELAGVAGVAGLSYYLYNKFKKSSKRRVKSSSSKSSSRKSTRRSKHSEQSSLS